MRKSHHYLELEAARKIAKSISRSNVLRFSLVRQILWGQVDGKKLGPFEALSGGGQSGTRPQGLKLEDWTPYKKKTSDKPGHRGGALVPGWWIVLPEKLAKYRCSSHLGWGSAPTGDSLRIIPYQLDPRYSQSDRDSFYIHGTGGKGSDGCILIGPEHRHVLVACVARGGGAWLHAYLSGTELNNAIEQSDRINKTA
jgi:hypothetical protein